MSPEELAEKIYRLLQSQDDWLYVGDNEFPSAVTVDGQVDLVRLATEIIAMSDQLQGRR